MSTFTRGLLAAFLGGASTGLTGYLSSHDTDQDLTSLAAVAVAGGFMGLSTYLTGLYSPVPLKKNGTNGAA